MKVKTSITLSEDLLKTVDEVSAEYKNRSDVIEQALRSFFQNRFYRLREIKDLKILNEKAEALNEEAEDVLSYHISVPSTAMNLSVFLNRSLPIFWDPFLMKK